MDEEKLQTDKSQIGLEQELKKSKANIAFLEASEREGKKVMLNLTEKV